MNIFLFTFILGWYTEFSIFDAKKSFNKNKREREEFTNGDGTGNGLVLNKLNIADEVKIILKYLGYSVLIYVIFLLTTKCELEYLVIFLVLILASFIIFIIKTYGKKESEIETTLELFRFISRETKDRQINDYLNNASNKDKPISLQQSEVSRIYTNYILTNVENMLFILSLIVLVLGVMFYLGRKKGEYLLDFSYLKFIFGTLRCKKNL
tara:strand:+ start:120 stop:749 length:630 start_codon:yes stop_codon:yes gene_type:complete